MEGERIGIQGQQGRLLTVKGTSPVYMNALGRVVGNECLDISNLM